MGLDITRLNCFNDKDFCRYYVGVKDPQKPREWVRFYLEHPGLLEKQAGRNRWKYIREAH